MSTRHTIRRAVPADAGALGAIQAESHRVTYPGIMPAAVLARLQAGRLAERFSLRLQAAADTSAPDDNRLWIVEVAGAVVGYAATQAGASTFQAPPPGAGELESLYLHPSVTGRGLGWALHEHAIHDLRARGFGPLVLWAFSANQTARRFYERAGWVLDVAEARWVLEGVSCPIVRYRLRRQPA
ncbi:N-acetyltransferase family protein [Rubrivivax sp. RP6-9]|uniref:GNAT family N-acetyltransferase n=1 Tax=Rubrivivax sp. RP6-9 TaxID=3415750 RepID=UPI003CC57A3E